MASPEIRLLGEVEVLRAGRPLPLPASKKTRALLGYLVTVRGRPQSRERLCELFWDGPDDPRAALRWSLTKIRPLVDDARATRLVADREHVAFESHGALVDLAAVADGAASPALASLEALKSAAAMYRGEFLEGLDLPECYRYHEWCTAERESARRLRSSILSVIAERLRDDPEEALSYARARVTIDPLVEAAHVAVMQLLARLGRPREALKQYEHCRRILQSQLGRPPSKDLERARAALGPEPPPRSGGEALSDAASFRDAPSTKSVRAALRTPLVGRVSERAVIAAAIEEARAGTAGSVLLFCGEPGIGKTRLLEDAVDQVVAVGGSALVGRAFEAEMVRPYGAWIDALRALPCPIDGSLRVDLAPLLPELGPAPAESDRNRLFEGVSKLLIARAAGGPVAVVLDDLQWFDEASAALLHYAARGRARSRVFFVCGARAAEIAGNPVVQGLLRALARENRLRRVDLPPLDEGAIKELVAGVDRGLDTHRIFASGGGNPLFSLELARAFAEGEGGRAAQGLDGLIADRLSRLDEHAAELLPWAAALGHVFSIDMLAALTSLPVCDLLAGVEELERHGVLRVANASFGSVGYDFAHDLVRQSAYRAMSEPRRRWIHLHAARTLQATHDPDGALAGEVAHHAALGGDSELAARAYVAAAERCLRVFALADGARLTVSGMQHVDRLPPEGATPLRLALLAVRVNSNQWLQRAGELEEELARVAASAERRGMHAEAARSYHLMSVVHHERGDFSSARTRSLQAAQAGRSADVETRQQQLANTARCLALIEHDVAYAGELLREARALGPATAGRALLELLFATGLVQAYEGMDEAAGSLEQAAELAALATDHFGQAQALTRIARLALEHGRPTEAIARCEALEPLAAKLSEGAEAPFIAALRALAGIEVGEDGAWDSAERALAELRRVDSKAHVAYVLNVLASHDARAGRTEPSRRRAREALHAADAVGQRSEAAVARARLAHLDLADGDAGRAAAWIQPCKEDFFDHLALSARARAALQAVGEAPSTW